MRCLSRADIIDACSEVFGASVSFSVGVVFFASLATEFGAIMVPLHAPYDPSVAIAIPTVISSVGLPRTEPTRQSIHDPLGSVCIPVDSRVYQALLRLVVVETPDALLITTRERSQDVSKLVRAIHESGREDLI